MNLTVRSFRATVTGLAFGFAGLTLAPTADATAIYDASAALTLEVTGISGDVPLAVAFQFVSSNGLVEKGDGAAANTATLTPGSFTTPILVGDTFTNSAVVTGSADSSGSRAESSLETGVTIFLQAGADGAQIDFGYEFTGSAMVSATDPGEFAEAFSSFLITDIAGSVLDGIGYAADTQMGPPADSGLVAGSFSVVLEPSSNATISVDINAAGLGAAVPAPAALLLLAVGLLGLGAARWRAGTSTA